MQAEARKIAQLLKSLPAEKCREVIDFVEYLQFRETEKRGLTAEVIESLKQVKSKKTRPARNILNEM